MWVLIIVAVLLIPVFIVLMVVRDLYREVLDSAASRIRNNPAVQKRAPFYRPLQAAGGILLLFALMPLILCIQGGTADQIRRMLDASAGLLAAGSLLLGLWWVLASLKMSDEATQA